MLEHGKSRPGMEILRSASSYLRILVIFLVDVAVAWWMHVSASLLGCTHIEPRSGFCHVLVLEF